MASRPPKRRAARFLLTALLWTTAPVLLMAAVGDNVAVGPRLEFTAIEHDFGRIRGGEVVCHEFTFSNTGDGLLEISGVKSSCGCAAIGAWPKEIEAGETAVIPVEYHSVNEHGAVREFITVRSNDPRNPQVMLLLKATIWHPIDVFPPQVILELPPGSAAPISAVLKLTNNTGAPIILSTPKSSHPALAASLGVGKAGREFELTVRTLPPLGTGNVFGKITLETSSALMPTLEIPVFALVLPAVRATPSAIVLPPGPLTNALATTVLVRGFWTNALHLSGLHLNHSKLTASLKEAEAGQAFLVTVNVPEGFQLAPGEKVELSVNSNHPQFPVIGVPILQSAAPSATAPDHR